ncbi:uncharacterized protein [Salvelinus alpinus]|uniref:uncharacterized protein n=1 Tax=Salvelinus alpinus TaxID=8036 RepID=UPI0039FCECF6
MVGRGFLGCFILCLSLASVCAINGTLNSIDDLRDKKFGHIFPRHGLMLVHWLANTIQMDNNDMTLNFNPTRRDYGIHFYGNADKPCPLPPLSRRHGSYYSLGNIGRNNNNGAMALPLYVTQGFENNRDRVVLRVREEEPNQHIVDEVYVTQHYPRNGNRGTGYDPIKTYRVNVSLLRQIQNLSNINLNVIPQTYDAEINHSSLQSLRNTWRDTPGLALLLALVLHFTCPNILFKEQALCLTSQPQSGMDNPRVEDDKSLIKLEVKTTDRGKARIIWSGIPKRLLDQGVMVVLYKSNGSESKLDRASVRGKASGSYNTSVPLNPGLQVRLHKKVMILCVFATIGDEICRSSEFHDANREIPASINDYDASLQLFVKDGKACARLYVKKSFTAWKKTFNNSWVGFYSSEGTLDHKTWQWAVKF